MSAVEKLVSRLEKDGEKSVAYWEGIAEGDWQLPVYEDGAAWDMTDLLIHIVNAEDQLRRLITGIANGEVGVPDDFDLDSYNERKVKEATLRDPKALILLFKERREATIVSFLNFTEESLRVEGKHPYLGYTNVAEMVKLMYLHVQIHIRDMRRVLEK